MACELFANGLYKAFITFKLSIQYMHHLPLVAFWAPAFEHSGFPYYRSRFIEKTLLIRLLHNPITFKISSNVSHLLTWPFHSSKNSCSSSVSFFALADFFPSFSSIRKFLFLNPSNRSGQPLPTVC